MIWNLDIAKDYGRLLDDIRKLSIKSQLLLEKGAAYQFDLSLIKLALSSAGMETETKKKKKINWIISHMKRTLTLLAGNINFTISKTIK